MHVEKIAIQQVEPDPEAIIRVVYDVEELAKSIEKVGQLEPVLAYKKGKKFYVYVGIRRYFAIKELYKKQGKPDFILAIVDQVEPDPDIKLSKIYEENSEKSRRGLNVYDKLALVLFNYKVAERLSKLGEISNRFLSHARNLQGMMSIEDLKRWYEIEKKASNAIRLNLEHITMILSLPPEKREFAIAVLSHYRIPAEGILDLNVVLAYSKVDTTLLERVGIKNPYTEEERKLLMTKKPEEEPEEVTRRIKIEQAPPPPSTSPSHSPSHESSYAPSPTHYGSESHFTSESAFPPSTEGVGELGVEVEVGNIPEAQSAVEQEEKEKPLVSIVKRGDYSFFPLQQKMYIFYPDIQPEVVLTKIEDGQVVEVNGQKIQFKLL